MLSPNNINKKKNLKEKILWKYLIILPVPFNAIANNKWKFKSWLSHNQVDASFVQFLNINKLYFLSVYYPVYFFTCLVPFILTMEF